MKRGPLWKITVATTVEAADAVSELLASVSAQPASIYTDADTGQTTVAVYCADKPERLAEMRCELGRGVLRICDCGLQAGSGKVSVQKIRREDWAESWKRHFKPIEVGRALLVKPSWSKRRAKRGQSVVVLDPGLSFGTGQHPTTGFCLRELMRRRRAGESQSFLDIGTGSGILAIAAAKLGYSPVHAFDFDPESVRVARANARVNDVLKRMNLKQADVTKLSVKRHRRFDVICANLISTLLIAERRRIASLLSENGVLVVAGILKTEFSQVQRAFESLALKLVAAKSEKEWRSGTFARRCH